MSRRPAPKGAREQEIGAQFRKIRREKGKTLEQVAAGLGISLNTLRWHEIGARMLRADKIAMAAELIGVAVHDLLPPTATMERFDEQQQRPDPGP